MILAGLPKIILQSLISGDGLIQEKELQHVMRACMDENGMKFDEGEVDELTRALFHDATVVCSSSSTSSNANEVNSGGITFDALKAQLTKHDGLLQNLSISIDRWLVPPKPKKPATFMESVMAKVNHHPSSLNVLMQSSCFQDPSPSKHSGK